MEMVKIVRKKSQNVKKNKIVRNKNVKPILIFAFTFFLLEDKMFFFNILISDSNIN